MPSPIALLAAPSRLGGLADWVGRHHDTLVGFELLVNAELADRLRSRPDTGGMRIDVVPPLADGGEIEVAARILRGEVVGLIAFLDPRTLGSAPPDPEVLLRACLIRQVPVALNEASASLALRGLARSRVAYLIFNPVAGQGDPQEE
ncbi:MAG: lipid kinase, partial [Synechococcaceae cyanobacterium]|nr:lipid kinase [Synechococcaceae cyanobacterium]